MGEIEGDAGLQLAAALHEAGRIVMALELGQPFEYASVQAGEPSEGMARGFLGVDSAIELVTSGAADQQGEDILLCLLAGQIAERIHTGQENDAVAAEDHKAIHEIVQHVCGSPEEGRALEKWLRLRAENYLRQQGVWNSVERLAVELLSGRTLTPEDCEELCGIDRPDPSWPIEWEFTCRNAGGTACLSFSLEGEEWQVTIELTRRELRSLHRHLTAQDFEPYEESPVPWMLEDHSLHTSCTLADNGREVSFAIRNCDLLTFAGDVAAALDDITPLHDED